MEEFETIVEPVRTFIEPHVAPRSGWRVGATGRRYTPLGYLIRVALRQLPDGEPASALGPVLKAGAADLFRLANEKPGHFNLAGGHTQYVLGYHATDVSLLPHDDVQRVMRWHELLGEAFQLAGSDMEESDENRFEEFREMARQLVVNLASIIVEADSSWRAINREPDEGATESV